MKVIALVLFGAALAAAGEIEWGASRCNGLNWSAANHASGAYLLPHKDCTKFWSCTTSGDAYAMDCPAGLHYNDAEKICDWPENAKCGDDGSVSSSSSSEETSPPPSSSSSSEETTAPLPSSSSSSSSSSEDSVSSEKNICDGHAWTEANQITNDYLLPHKDCTKFWSCTAAGTPVQMDCPAGLHFSAKNKICDWPADAKCA